MRYDPIDPQLFIENRRRLAARLKPNSIAVLNSSDVMPKSADGVHPFIQQTDLFYLSGIDQEESTLVLFPDAREEKHREVLFLQGDQRADRPVGRQEIHEGRGDGRLRCARPFIGTRSSSRCSGPWCFRPSGFTSTRTSTCGRQRSSKPGTRASANGAARPSRCTATSGWRRSCTTCARSNRRSRSSSSDRRRPSPDGRSGACSASSGRGSGSTRSRPRSGTSSCGRAPAAPPSRPSWPRAPTPARCTT